jgi:predicted DNA binding CopG/RHH family protein
MKNKKLKPIPKFKNEHEEDQFWQKANLKDYVDFDEFKPVSFPNLKLTSKTISIRMPLSLLDSLKVEASRLDMPYQTLAKQLIMKGLRNQSL